MFYSSDWKSTLISIIKELDASEFEKMLEYLEEIPKSRRNPKSRIQMAQKIIEQYGEERSISEVSRVMDLIPRRDSTIQNLPQPFIDKLKSGLGKDKMGEFSLMQF